MMNIRLIPALALALLVPMLSVSHAELSSNTAGQAKKINVVGGVWSWKDIPKYEEYNDYPSRSNPWTTSNKTKEREGLKAFISEIRKDKANKIKAFPSAESFPGIPEDGAPIITKTVEINPQYSGWHSTGMYALPGVPITVKLNSRAKLKGEGEGRYSVRIGPHTDVLNLEKHASWQRTPELSYSKSATTYKVEMASPSGGLIYICQKNPDSRGKPIPVEISGAIEAPMYIMGKTTLEDWKQQLEKSTAPWGEIVCPRLIATIRLQDLKSIQDIEKTAEVLQKSLDAQDWLAGWDKTPGRLTQPMRFVTDPQPSAGAGHSGYPAMGGLSWGDRIGDGSLITSGHWGLWHETGHNHQNAPYRMDGMGEITVNLFTLVSHFKGLGLTISDWGPFYSSDDKMGDFFRNKKSFYDVNGDHFLQLMFFAELFHGVGFEPFREASIKFQKKPYDNSTSNQEKWEWLMVALSEASKRNLAPYFDAWGFNVSNRSKKKIEEFPVWLPNPEYPKNLVDGKGSIRTDSVFGADDPNKRRGGASSNGEAQPVDDGTPDDYAEWFKERFKQAEAEDAKNKAAQEAAQNAPRQEAPQTAGEAGESTEDIHIVVDDFADDEASSGQQPAPTPQPAPVPTPAQPR